MNSIVAIHTITGNISTEQTLYCDVTADRSLQGSVATGKVAVDLPVYDGDYTVIPLAKTEQVLLTENKYMVSNVTVEKIPYAEVSNLANGITATIGEI